MLVWMVNSIWRRLSYELEIWSLSGFHRLFGGYLSGRNETRSKINTLNRVEKSPFCTTSCP